MSQMQPARRSPEPFDSRAPDKRDMGAELDNIFRLTTIPPPIQAAAERPAPLAAAAPEPRRVSQSDLDAALDMLSRAAQAMDILQARYHQVEGYARDIAERAERDIAKAYGEVKGWEARALGSESRMDELNTRTGEAERQAEAAQRRAIEAERQAETAQRRAEQVERQLEAAQRLVEQAERGAEVAQRRAEQAERSANEAREWLECFHDKIVASFDSRPFLKVAVA